MFVTNFQDSVYSLLLRFLKSKEFGSTTHFVSLQTYFENKQIMFITVVDYEPYSYKLYRCGCKAHQTSITSDVVVRHTRLL